MKLKTTYNQHKGNRIISSRFSSIICFDSITGQQMDYCEELDNWFIVGDPILKKVSTYGTHCQIYGSLKSALRKIRRWGKSFRTYEILHKYQNYHVTVKI